MIAKAAGLVALIALTAGLLSQAPPRLTPGEISDGLYQLPNGWRVRPAGRQIRLDTMPMASVVSPDGKFLIVLCGGYNPPSLIVLEQATLREIGRTPVPDGWLGLAINRAGDRVYVGGGTQAAVFEFRFNNGTLELARRINLTEPAQRETRDFVGDVALSADERFLYVARLYRDGIDVVNLGSGEVASRFGTGRRPYRILPHPAGTFVYVSSWLMGQSIATARKPALWWTASRWVRIPLTCCWWLAAWSARRMTMTTSLLRRYPMSPGSSLPRATPTALMCLVWRKVARLRCTSPSIWR